jgi:hypothetical protein
MYEVKIDATIPLVRREGVEFARVDGRPLPLDAVYPAGDPSCLAPQ